MGEESIAEDYSRSNQLLIIYRWTDLVPGMTLDWPLYRKSGHMINVLVICIKQYWISIFLGLGNSTYATGLKNNLY